jgi:MSHA biogenesis protein MshP
MKISNQHGFTLVQAVFIVVVLGLLGAMMVRLIGVQSSTTTFALQGARAYQAARSGLEWGAARASVPPNSCVGGLGSTMTIENFNVTVICTSQAFTEGTNNMTVYLLNAVAEFGNYGNPDYVRRQLQMKMGL